MKNQGLEWIEICVTDIFDIILKGMKVNYGVPVMRCVESARHMQKYAPWSSALLVICNLWKELTWKMLIFLYHVFCIFPTSCPSTQMNGTLKLREPYYTFSRTFVMFYLCIFFPWETYPSEYYMIPNKGCIRKKKVSSSASY